MVHGSRRAHSEVDGGGGSREPSSSDPFSQSLKDILAGAASASQVPRGTRPRLFDDEDNKDPLAPKKTAVSKTVHS